MVYLRDPLSVQYDPQARLVIRLAIEQHTKRAKNQRLVPYVRVRVDNPIGESLVRDEGGLSRAERAFQRALYHDQRIHKPRKNSPGEWSMKVDWDPAPPLPGLHRNVRITLYRDTEGRRHVDRKRKRDRWTGNVTLQSGGIGSPKQRFPA